VHLLNSELIRWEENLNPGTFFTWQNQTLYLLVLKD
jgi:hypothetical protein